MITKLIRFKKGELHITPKKLSMDGGTASKDDEITHYEHYDIEDLKLLKSKIKMALKRQRFLR